MELYIYAMVITGAILVIAIIIFFAIYLPSKNLSYENEGQIFYEYIPETKELIIFIDEERLIIENIDSLEEGVDMIEKRLKKE